MDLGFKSFAQVAQIHHGGYVSAIDDAQIESCRIGDTSNFRDQNKYWSKPELISYKIL